MRVLSAILLVAALLWSLVGYGLWALARTGPAAVAALGGWLGLEPGALQWLGDGLAMAGPAMQVVVIIVWVIGLAGIIALGVVLPRLARETRDVARAVRAGERPSLDPDVAKRFRR